MSSKLDNHIRECFARAASSNKTPGDSFSPEQINVILEGLRSAGCTCLKRVRRCISAPLEEVVSPITKRPLTASGTFAGAPCLLNALVLDHCTSEHGQVWEIPYEVLEEIMESKDAMPTPNAASILAVAHLLILDNPEQARVLAKALASKGLKTACLLRRLLCSLSGNMAPNSVPFSNEERQLLQQLTRLEVVQGGPVLFTAPHGVWLQRLPGEVHKPEDWTTHLAHRMGKAVAGSVAVWSDAERARSEYYRMPNSSSLDPNFLEVDVHHAGTSPFGRVLLAHVAKHGPAQLHCDLHGRRDWKPSLEGVVDHSDLDLGMAAMERCDPRWTLHFRDALVTALRQFFEAHLPVEHPPFVVCSNPRLTGVARDGRMTMSQQGVDRHLHSVQLEMSLRLRRWLSDQKHAEEMAALLHQVWKQTWMDFQKHLQEAS